MLILLPIAVWCLLLLLLSRQDNSWRRSYLGATLIWGVLLTVITEGLSLFRALQFGWLIVAWGSIVLALGALYKRLPAGRSLPIATPAPFPYWLLLGPSLIVALVGITALVAPPNNWDALSYHLPRVMHWIQNRSVAHYPTNYLPQLYQSPWAEFGLLHLQILSGGDRFANILQWSSLVGCLVGTSLIAQTLGGDRRGQALTMVFCATLPMGVLQGSNTKNDYVLAFWLVCLAYYALLIFQGQISPALVGGVSASLGLALLTKGTAYLYVLPLLVLVLVGLVRHLGWKSWQPGLAIALLPLLLNLGHYSRNLDLFGTPLASGEQQYTNTLFNLAVLVSNLVRNLSLHLVIPFASGWNQGLVELVDWLHGAIALSTNDPRTTWAGTPFDLLLLAKNQNEDTVGNPGHLLVGLVAVIVAWLNWGRTRSAARTAEQRLVLTYGCTIGLAFLLFCLGLKWQPWHSRLHLPLFVLFSAFSGVVLSKLIPQRLVTYLAIFLIQLSLFWICFNGARPLIANQTIFNSSRTSLYFHNRQDLEKVYAGAIASIQSTQCPQIGLVLRADILEYLIWVLFSQNQRPIPRLEHINVRNVSVAKSSVEPFRSFMPCANITIQ